MLKFYRHIYSQQYAFPSQNKEWLCLTCQMQRGLVAAESVEPPLMKPHGSPNKASTPGSAANQKKDISSSQKSDMTDKNLQDIPTAGATNRKGMLLHGEESSVSVLAPTNEKTACSPSTTEIQKPITSPIEERAIICVFNKPPSSQIVDTEKKDISQPCPTAAKDMLDKQEVKAGKQQKLTDLPVTSTSEENPQNAQEKEPNPYEKSPEKSTPSVALQTKEEESRGLPRITHPKSQLASSRTTEAVTGKMLGFGSSLFSSASTLITSAVQESRTTPPNSRKMSAPTQVSDKVPASEISAKSNLPGTLKIMSAKEAKPPTAKKPQTEKTQDEPQQMKTPPSVQAKFSRSPSEPERPELTKVAPKVGPSTCPLCKADLNVGSKEILNFNTCTDCKMIVCNKCGFSPMPSVKEVIKWPRFHAEFIFSFRIFYSYIRYRPQN